MKPLLLPLPPLHTILPTQSAIGVVVVLVVPPLLHLLLLPVVVVLSGLVLLLLLVVVGILISEEERGHDIGGRPSISYSRGQMTSCCLMNIR